MGRTGCGGRARQSGGQGARGGAKKTRQEMMAEIQARRRRQKWQEDVRLGSISKEELIRFADGLDIRGEMNSRDGGICRIISGRMELLFMGQEEGACWGGASYALVKFEMRIRDVDIEFREVFWAGDTHFAST